MKSTQTILIVDDVPSNLRALADLLSPFYEIRVATSGEDALEATSSEEPPDLILLDILMPGIDGYAVCRALKRHGSTREIPIIFITAKDEVKDETHGFEVGAVDYISKPFDGQIVLARVRNQLALKEKMDRLRGSKPVEKACLFSPQGNHWRVRFRNEDDFLLADSRGASYLSLLLMEAGRSFPVEELVFHLSERERNIFLADARQFIGNETMLNIRQRLEALEVKRQYAVERQDAAHLSEVHREIDGLICELRCAGGGETALKHLAAMHRERLRKAVGNALRRCLNEIAQYSGELAGHLQFPRLRMGYELVYEPGDETVWCLFP